MPKSIGGKSGSMSGSGSLGHGKKMVGQGGSMGKSHKPFSKMASPAGKK